MEGVHSTSRPWQDKVPYHILEDFFKKLCIRKQNMGAWLVKGVVFFKTKFGKKKEEIP